MNNNNSSSSSKKVKKSLDTKNKVKKDNNKFKVIIKDSNNKNNSATNQLSINSNNNTDKNEILFWKIFRNIYINKIIFENLNKLNKTINKFRKGVYKYDEIISVKWLLKNQLNGDNINMLKQKVNNSEYLIDFISLNDKYNNNSILLNNLSLNEKIQPSKQIRSNLHIFNIIKNDKSSLSFYSNLFKNYKYYFIEDYPEIKELESNHTSIYKNHNYNKKLLSTIEYTARLLIDYDNWLPLELLISNYNFKISFELFQYSFENGSKECSLNLFKLLNNQDRMKEEEQDSNNLISKLWSNIFCNVSYHYDDDYDYDYSSDKVLNKIEILKELNLNAPKVQQLSDHVENHNILLLDISKLTISRLIRYCESILWLFNESNLHFFNNLFENIKKRNSLIKVKGYPNYLKNYFPNLSSKLITSLNNEIIKSLKQQHDSIHQQIVYNSNSNNYEIKSLFQFLLNFTSQSNLCFLNNFIFFKIKYEKEYNLISDYYVANSKEDNKFINYLTPFEFGDYDEIERNNNNSYNYGTINLFKYCKDDKEKQLKFINNAINDFKKIGNLKNQRISIQNLLSLLISNNYLEYIKMILKEQFQPTASSRVSSTRSSNIKNLFNKNIFKEISSIEMFDYLYEIGVIENEFNLNDCLLTNYELLNHLKLNYYNEIYLNLINGSSGSNGGKTTTTTTILNYTNQSLLFIYKNINDFLKIYDKIDVWNLDRELDTSKNGDGNDLNIQDYELLVKSTPLNKSYHCFLQSNLISSLDQINWVYNNRIEDIKINKRCCFINQSITRIKHLETDRILYYFYNGKLNEIINETYIINQTKRSIILDNNIDLLASKIGDFNSIKLIIDNLLETNNLNNQQQQQQQHRNPNFQGRIINDIFFGILLNLSKFGHLNIFKLLLKNYNNWFIDHTNEKDDDEIEQYFFYNYSYKNIPFSKFLKTKYLEILKVAQKENHIDLLLYLNNDFFKNIINK